MNERDELAKLLFVTDNFDAADAEHEWEMLNRHSPEYTKYVIHMSDAILAAGYRKPRTITTNAELDALPNHSVIVDKDADIWQKRGDEWCSYETNPHISVRLLKYAPLTVIHEGGVA